MFSSCALPELGKVSATNVNKLTNFEYANLFSNMHFVLLNAWVPEGKNDASVKSPRMQFHDLTYVSDIDLQGSVITRARRVRPRARNHSTL